MYKLFSLCILLLLVLTACAPAIETDESTWVDEITLNTTEETTLGTTTTSSVSDTETEATTTTTAATTTGTTGSSAASSATTTTADATTTTTTTTRATTAGSTAGADITVGYVNATTLNVRPEPNTVCEPIGGLKHGEQVTVLGRSGDWYVIRFGEGQAYVSAQYISSTPVG